MVNPSRGVGALLVALVAAHSAAAADLPAGKNEDGADSPRPSSVESIVAAPAEEALLEPGLLLLGGGAALLATTASGYVLLEALTTPDRSQSPQPFPELVQVAGFGALTLASVSAGLMLLGGGMLLVDGDEGEDVPRQDRPGDTG